MRRKRLDDMTYAELVDQRPCDVIEGEAPLPLTEENVVAMPKVAQWRVVNEGKRSPSPQEKEAMGRHLVQKKIKFDQVVSEQESSS